MKPNTEEIWGVRPLRLGLLAFGGFGSAVEAYLTDSIPTRLILIACSAFLITGLARDLLAGDRKSTP